MHYYNEFDGKAAAWLRELSRAGHIMEGHVDERSITDVHGSDVSRYTQCHFFAGIGGWPYALRLAGWPSDKPVWTGSCPCQPFSAAGKRLGTKDPRHLWPEFHRLIAQCRPPIIFGEQVASKDGRLWLAGVRADLEALGYAVGAADLCAAGAGAPHIRQRLWWVADSKHAIRRKEHRPIEDERDRQDPRRTQAHRKPGTRCKVRGLGQSGGAGFQTREREELRGARRRDEGRAVLQSGGAPDGLEHASGNGRKQRRPATGQRGVEPRCELGGLGNATGSRRDGAQQGPEGEARHEARVRVPDETGGNGFWRDFDLLPCLDGKARRVEPGTFPLAHGVSGRVGLLRGYGNAIVPQVAAEFIKAYMETRS